jgi:hypothetical protein
MITERRWHAKDLRESGRLAGPRPEVALLPIPITIDYPDLEIVPKGPGDALLILGLGTVAPVLEGDMGNRKVVLPNSTMKINALAAVLLAKNGFVKKGGLVIPSGTATADPQDVEEARKVRASIVTKQKEIPESIARLPVSEAEETYVYEATEAGLMTDVINTTANSLNIEILPDHDATETLENFINAINELDKRSLAKNEKIFNGNLMVVTSNNHLPRAEETARFLGLEKQVVPLASQDVLIHFGEKPKAPFDKTLWVEQKWIRALHQLPSYILPVLDQIESNERLIQILEHLRKNDGYSEAFDKFGLQDLSIGAQALRKKLASIDRCNPLEEVWMKRDSEATMEAVSVYSDFTRAWLRREDLALAA